MKQNRFGIKFKLTGIALMIALSMAACNKSDEPDTPNQSGGKVDTSIRNPNVNPTDKL